MSKEKQNIFENLIRVPVFLLVFLMPVVFSSRFVHDAFGIPKITVLRIFAPLIFFFWALKKFVSREVVKISAITYLAAAFVFTAGVSTVFSKDFFVSFLGLCPYYEWGFTSVFAGFLLFIVVGDEFEMDDWTAIGAVILIAASVVCVYGVAQMLGFDPFYKATYSFSRVFSTLGNPNFLGGYLVTVIPLALAFYLAAPLKYIPYIFALNVLLAVNLGLTLSRASWLAAGLSVVLFVLILGAENKKRGGKRLLVLWASFAVVFFVFLAGRKGLQSPQQPAQESLVAARAGVLVSVQEASASARLEGWKSAIEMFKDNFWHGVGPNLFKYMSPRYMTLKFAQQTSGKSVSNYAHNTILQVASTMGIFALVAYLTLWLSVLFFGFKRVLNTSGGKRLYLAGVASSFFALFMFLQFHFFLNETMIYFWLLAGFVSSSVPPRKVNAGIFGRYLLIGFSFIFIPFYFILAGRHFLADIHFMKKTNDYKTSAGLMPRSPMYTAACAVRHKDNALKTGDLSSLYYAEKLAGKNIEFHPENPWALSDLGIVEMAKIQLGESNDPGKAEEFFRKAWEAGPYLYINVLNLSEFYHFTGKVGLKEKYAALAKRIKEGGKR